MTGEGVFTGMVSWSTSTQSSASSDHSYCGVFFLVGCGVDTTISSTTASGSIGCGVDTGISFTIGSVACDCDGELVMTTEDGLGLPPPLPPMGLAIVSLSDSGGIEGDLDGSKIVEDIGCFVTAKTSSKIGVAFSIGEVVGSFVIEFVGGGVGDLLFSLHDGDHIALSLQ